MPISKDALKDLTRLTIQMNTPRATASINPATSLCSSLHGPRHPLWATSPSFPASHTSLPKGTLISPGPSKPQHLNFVCSFASFESLSSYISRHLSLSAHAMPSSGAIFVPASVAMTVS